MEFTDIMTKLNETTKDNKKLKADLSAIKIV